MLNNKQRELINSIDSLEEWQDVIKELQDFIIEDEEIIVFIHNDTVTISKEYIRLNGLSVELDIFTFTDFEKIYTEFATYISNNS